MIRSWKNDFGWQTYFLTSTLTNGCPLIGFFEAEVVPFTSRGNVKNGNSVSDAASDATPNTKVWHENA
jgi:hypothetical protein